MASYKIKDVETLTGIKSHTLRIWESRYGILKPSRSETKIRSYSDSDLVYLLSISLLSQHGFKISKISAMNTEELKTSMQSIKTIKATETSIDALIMSLIELDEDLFHSTLTQVIEMEGLERTFTHHLIPFLDRLGVMWLTGTINPVQEHFISNLIRQKIISEIDKLPVPEKKDNPILMYLPEHEWHEISLLFYQFLIRKEGQFTVYLGQSLPVEALVVCIEKIQPKRIFTSWLTSVDSSFIVGYFKKLKDQFPNLEIYAGGAQIGIHIDAVRPYVVPVLSPKDLNPIHS